MKPFVKWVGGKGRVIAQLERLFPDSYNNYFEPFVGGGAVFFHIKHDNAVINDINASLMSAYDNIRTNVELVIKELKKIESRYHSLDTESQKLMYYEIREQYNLIVDKSSIKRTVYLIFLNKTCFNGMYRENSKGGFNVPFGKYQNQTICDEVNLRAISEQLSGVEILSGSYIDAVVNAKKGDFVYFDPPYHPLNTTSSFTSYSKDDFIEKDQLQLKTLIDELTQRGCKVMMSNSYSKYILSLYKDYKTYKIKVGRSINSDGAKRGKISEVVVTNY